VKRFALPILLVLALPCGVSMKGAAATTPAASQRSQNGLFSADITSTAPNEIILGVQRHEGDMKIFSWSKKVPWNGANATITVFPWIKRFISNDGQTVILHNQQFRSESWVWISKTGEPVRYFASDFSRAVGKSVENNAFGNSFMNQSGLLQFIFDEQRVHALWFPSVDKWLTIDLKTGELKAPGETIAAALASIPSNTSKSDLWLKLPSEDLVHLLNAEGTRRSLEAVRKHQPTAIKMMLKPVHEKLSALIPSLKSSGQAQLLSLAEAYAGYIFLARHKVAAAETYIRKLLEMPFEQKITHTMFRGAPEFTVLSQERMLGDLAWRLWNGIKVDSNAPRTELHFPGFTSATQEYLGAGAGQIRLPMVRPDTKPGAVWVYLIPAAVQPGAWSKARGVIPLYCHLETFAAPAATMRRYSNQFQFDAVGYRFETIAPGEYRLKAIWDRRLPLADQTGIGIPEPGDYESSESEPFTIVAGANSNGPELYCTNTIGQAETYYAADQAWKKRNPNPRGRPPYLSPPAYRLGTIQYRDGIDVGQQWVVTNTIAAKGFEFRKGEVIQVVPIGAPLERDELIITFGVRDLNDSSLRKLIPQIRDEHGCTFEATLFVPAQRAGPGEITVRAAVFPRKKQFTLSLRSGSEDKIISSFSIKNGGASQTALWRTRPLPISRMIAGKNVQLKALNRTSGAKFQVFEQGEGKDWTPESVIYQDREGNRSFEADDFCRKDNEIRVQIGRGGDARVYCRIRG
jgi:hypothetical protein